MQQLKLDIRESLDTTANPADPVLLCAADENYVKPLAVTLHSAASHLRVGARLRVLVMDGGLSEGSWHALRETLNDLPVDMHVIVPDRGLVEDLVTSHHITHTAYLRLLAARLLPDSIDKLIYLDSDVLVQDDLCKLWETDLEGNYCLAVPDIACPFVDARKADSNFKKSSPYMAALSPIRNWKQLGLDPAEPYFNSGVMVINLARWREEQIHVRLLDILRKHRRFVWCWDQYALNVAFSGNWKALPLRWNQGAHAFDYPDDTHSPLDREQFREMRKNPAIIHFTTEWKPWHARPYHRLHRKFIEYMDQHTVWSGWRPEQPSFNLKRWWDDRAVDFIRIATVRYRQLAAIWA
ncbi:MAG: glycosyltransferase family 8 protein [Planctomycetota bacterium]